MFWWLRALARAALFLAWFCFLRRYLFFLAWRLARAVMVITTAPWKAATARFPMDLTAACTVDLWDTILFLSDLWSAWVLAFAALWAAAAAALAFFRSAAGVCTRFSSSVKTSKTLSLNSSEP